MNNRSQEEISAEVEKLKSIQPKVRAYSAFGDNNRSAISAQIDVLEHHWDEEDTDELETDHERTNALDAIYWRNGDEEISPSEGWAELITA